MTFYSYMGEMPISASFIQSVYSEQQLLFETFLMKKCFLVLVRITKSLTTSRKKSFRLLTLHGCHNLLICSIVLKGSERPNGQNLKEKFFENGMKSNSKNRNLSHCSITAGFLYVFSFCPISISQPIRSFHLSLLSNNAQGVPTN